jgi:hypothetical protein
MRILIKNYRNISVVLLLMVLILPFSCRKSDYNAPEGTETIRDNGGGIGTTTWTRDKDYLIEGFVYVSDGQVLTIESGTVIRAKSGQGSASSALIVARGGMIIAEGTSSDPIIFTVEGDDLKGSVPVEAKGLWGGVIILGSASLNLSGGESHIEGIPLSEPRGIYGGTNDDDNSGIFRYISIRHGGTNIGEGNEINGLTLGGVGRETTIDHVEVISNADDGIEFFGGTVNCTFIAIAFCGDDAFDYDLGYRGKGQFWFAVQQVATGDKLIECNGGTDPVVGTPYSLPLIYNVTMIGAGEQFEKKAIAFSLNGGGVFANSILINQGKGVFIEYVENSDDSYKQFERGNLELKNNIFFNVENNVPDDIFNILAAEGVDISEESEQIKAYFFSAGNEVSDPGIMVSGDAVNPIPTGNVYDNLAEYNDPWFEAVGFKGAFYTYNWLSGWTLLSECGYIVDQ